MRSRSAFESRVVAELPLPATVYSAAHCPGSPVRRGCHDDYMKTQNVIVSLERRIMR